jgi:photosystem II stability/assembly factor-like uncharacterized protein
MEKIRILNRGCRNFLILAIITTLLFSTTITLSYATVSFTNTNLKNNSYLGDWESQESGTTQKLSGVSFPEEDIGTSVGDSATILHTEDGGENWDDQTCGVSLNLYDVSFYDSDTGMAVGAEGTILNTNDGGDNWNTYLTGWMIEYFACHMVTDLVGYAVGVNTINQPLVTWTTDGWNSQNDVVFYLDGNEGRLNDVCFIDTDTGYAAARSWTGEGAIVKTTNGGNNWNIIYWADYSFFGIDFPSAEVGYAVGDNGLIVKTSNGGDSWQSLNSGVGNSLADVSFPTEDIGTVVGDSGIIIKTEDGGDNWVEEVSGTSNDLFSVDFIDSGNGYAVGDGGIILHHLGSDPPSAPDISGPSSDIVQTDVVYTFVSTDPEDEDVSYYIEWGDGEVEDWIGPYPSGEVKIISHFWEDIGTYEVRAKARDINNVEGDWSEILTVNISNPPDPPVIDGPKKGDVNVEYPYTFVATDPEDEDVYYWIVWGDGCPAVEWIGPYASGEIVTVNHAFTRGGVITISAQAKDINELEGDWGSLAVEMPRAKTSISSLWLKFSGMFPILERILNYIL